MLNFQIRFSPDRIFAVFTDGIKVTEIYPYAIIKGIINIADVLKKFQEGFFFQ